jgi:hypothetical protein
VALTTVVPLLWGIGATAKIVGAIDGDGKGSKHWRVGHDVTPYQARGWDGGRGGMKRERRKLEKRKGRL